MLGQDIVFRKIVLFSGNLQPMSDMDTLLTAKQLQELLHVDCITIYRMLQGERLQGIKAGGQWHFPRQAIEHWLREPRASTPRLPPRQPPVCAPYKMSLPRRLA